jgi:S-adenosylmethionine synthetase
MGRTPETVTKTFSAPGGHQKTITVELFTWEKLDFVDQVKAALDCSSIHNKIENQLN